MKGTIISIEGTDGAGKHTQQQLLAKTLKEQGYNVFEQSFPLILPMFQNHQP